MNSKKVLIVCRGFYPQNSPRSFRATELAKEFARQGHKVTVLTPKNAPVHIPFEKEYGTTIIDLGRAKWNPIKYSKSKYSELLARAINRFMQMAFEYPNIEFYFKVREALKGLSGFDVLISVAVPYPIHWGVAAVWTRKIAKTWIADCGDPFMGNETDSFRKWFHFKYVEKWFMRKADFISIPVESAKRAYYPEFHRKIRIIPQGFKIVPAEDDQTKGQGTVTTFAYAGGFIPGLRDPRLFLEFLAQQKMQFRFIVYTNQPDLVNSFKSKLKDKLTVRDYIPREELLQVLGKMDFLVNFDNNKGTAVPSKLIDYAIVGRPVLNIRHDLDITVINEFLNGNYSNRMVLPDIEQYKIENVCSKFLSLTKAEND